MLALLRIEHDREAVARLWHVDLGRPGLQRKRQVESLPSGRSTGGGSLTRPSRRGPTPRPAHASRQESVR